MLGLLRKFILGISPGAVRCEQRGFRVSDGRVRARIEQIGSAFREGYHAALDQDRFAQLLPRLETQPLELRGFAFEGAAMALAMLDALTPWNRNRLASFLKGPGGAHTYMVHVAVGWMAARVPVSPERLRAGLDPLLGWLLYDGYGFHEGFFNWRRYLGAHARQWPARLRGYARRVFDQGMGRSLWFVEGANAARLGATIDDLAPTRRGDLWSGVGLAATYAGGVEESGLCEVLQAAGPFQPHLAQGAAFAAKARQHAGNITQHTERACEIFCRASVELAARSTDEAMENLPSDAFEPAYEIWRQRIQARWAASKRLATE